MIASALGQVKDPAEHSRPARVIRPSGAGAIVPRVAIASSTRCASCGPDSSPTRARARLNAVNPASTRW
ncbi:MAG: hypothetical protein DME04_10670 [Candidatus Rokuibacteriota bacterium]|nr:MAG: hypothetical protein DME04_10670 [Candidatus Rokubacteria bacterium]